VTSFKVRWKILHRFRWKFVSLSNRAKWWRSGLARSRCISYSIIMPMTNWQIQKQTFKKYVY